MTGVQTCALPIYGWSGRTPTNRQKRLRGKIVKTHHGRQYKKGPSPCTEKKEEGTRTRKQRDNIIALQKKSVENRVAKLRRERELEEKTESR